VETGETPPSIYGVPTDFQLPGELHSLNKDFEANSQTYDDYFGPLFKSEHLRRFELLSDFPGADSAANVPDDILKLLRWDSAEYPGAFSVAP
jgi:hypothetical protein